MKYYLFGTLFAFAILMVGCGKPDNVPSRTNPHTSTPTTLSLVPQQREPWISLPTEEWPRIRLGQTATIKGKRAQTGANAFLIKTPDNRLFSATARHVVEIPGSISELGNDVDSWFLNDDTDDKVALGKPYAAIRDAILVECPGDRLHLPFQALPLRQTPLRKGEPIWLIGFRQGAGKKGRVVYPGKILDTGKDEWFHFSIEPAISYLGHSGAPVIDADGHAVGVFLGSDEKADVQGRVGTCVAQLLSPFFDDNYWSKRVTLTVDAEAHVKNLLTGEIKGSLLRLTMKPGADDTVGLELFLDNMPEEGDLKLVVQGIPIAIDRASQPFAIDIRIDYDITKKKFDTQSSKSWRVNAP